MTSTPTCPLEGCQISRTHSHGTDVTYAPAPPVVVADPRPHSRACGIRRHEHGRDCHYNCPSCGGKDPGDKINLSRSFLPLKGYCPLGCGKTLGVFLDGAVLCRNPECPTPDSVGRLLADPHIEAHIVEVHDAKRGNVSMQHPLYERLGGVLLDSCPLDAYLREQNAGIPVTEEDRYTVTPCDGGGWTWT